MRFFLSVLSGIAAGFLALAVVTAPELLAPIGRLTQVVAHRVRSASRSRRFATLPDFLELLALALSCGHPLASAWPIAVRFMPAGDLKGDLELASAALRYGRRADQCLSDLAARIGDPRAAMALALIAQALVMGNAVEEALLGQARSLRRLRLADVERRAQTAPLRMMLPVLGLILPAVMIVLLGPIVLRLMQGGLFS